jgi:hypothetical protein
MGWRLVGEVQGHVDEATQNQGRKEEPDSYLASRQTPTPLETITGRQMQLPLAQLNKQRQVHEGLPSRRG